MVFGLVEVSSFKGIAWFLRPSLGFGVGIEGQHTNAGRPISTTVGLARLDACGRVVGNYLDRRGMQLELCMGTDGGYVSYSEGSPTRPLASRGPATGRKPYLSTGPGFALRGDLGSQLAVHVRGTVGLNLLRDEFIDPENTPIGPSAFATRGEVGLSWRLR